MDLREQLVPFDIALAVGLVTPEFITGDLPAFAFTPLPEERPEPLTDEAGQRYIPFGGLGLGRLRGSLDALINDPSATSEDLATAQNARVILGLFVQDISFSHDPNGPPNIPKVHYILWNAEHVMFYPDSADPAYLAYQDQLGQLQSRRAAGEEIEPDFLDSLRRQETILFRGNENREKRQQAMTRAVQYHLSNVVCRVAVMLTLYSLEEYFAIIDRLDEEQTEEPPKKTKRKPKAAAVQSSKKADRAEPYLKSKHLVGQLVKYTYPKDNPVSIANQFDSLPDATKAKILKSNVEISSLVEGVRLTATEIQIVDVLCKMLHRQSQTKDSKRGDYYKGLPDSPTAWFGGRMEIAPQIGFSLYELTKEYKAKDAAERIGGEDVTGVATALKKLAGKQFLISYTTRNRRPDGGEDIQIVRDFQHLVTLPEVINISTDSKGNLISANKEIKVVLNPVFAHQIDSSFIKCPDDLLKRTIIAYGGKPSEAAFALRDRLQQELSYGKDKWLVGVDRLYHLLCPKQMKQSRRKPAADLTTKAIQTVKNLGLVTECIDEVAKTTGEPMLVFRLNREWE